MMRGGVNTESGVSIEHLSGSRLRAGQRAAHAFMSRVRTIHHLSS